MSTTGIVKRVVGLAIAALLVTHQQGADAHTTAMTDLPEGCLASVRNGSLPVDEQLGIVSGDVRVTLPGYTDEGCLGYTWAEFYGLFDRTRIIKPSYGINVSTSEWDCNHTSLTFGVYKKVTIPLPIGGSLTTWTFVGGGQMYGLLVNGTCTYDPENFPHGLGTKTLTLTTGGTYRVATKSWQHDDVDLGHPGTACDGEDMCHHETKLFIDQQ